MSDSIKLAVAGLGTVGVGAIELLDKQSALLMERSGKRIEIVAVARATNQRIGVSISQNSSGSMIRSIWRRMPAPMSLLS